MNTVTIPPISHPDDSPLTVTVPQGCHVELERCVDTWTGAVVRQVARIVKTEPTKPETL
jgi:hypothetical protein